MIVCETARMTVRRLEMADFADLHAICGDPEVMRFVGNLQPYTPEQTRAAIESAQAYYRQYCFGPWCVVGKTAGNLMAYAGLEFLPERDIPEVFYILAPAYWGHGYATELAAALLEYGFRACDLPQIGASFDPANSASMRVARKAGMRFSHHGLDEFALPTVYYVMDNPSSAGLASEALCLPRS
jgi:RimJ/RimL family protein N-acetyltransferase